MTLPPPGRFSYTTGWPTRVESWSATTRPMMSVPPPAACELMNLIGRSGQVCAAATLQGADSNAESSNQRKILLISVSPGSDAGRFRDPVSVPSLPGPMPILIDWPRAPDGRSLSWATQIRPGSADERPQPPAPRLDDRGPRAAGRAGAPLHAGRVRAASRELARRAHVSARGLDQGRAGRPALRRRCPRNTAARAARFAHEAVINREYSLAGFDTLRRAAAFRHRRALHPALRHRGAEEALAAQARHRRTGRRHRHERARHRLRPAGRAHHRGEEGQPLRAQRLQDLHHQRPARQPDRRGRQDRSEGARQGHLADGGGDRRRAGLPPRPQAQEARHGFGRHLRAVLRGRVAADREPARHRGRPGLRRS